MSEAAVTAPKARDATDRPAWRPRLRSRLGSLWEILLRSLGPVILALIAGGILLLALGRNPITFYANVYRGGIELGAWEDSIMRMAPLLLIAAGLIVVFQAGIWNLGIDGQFLLAAAVISGVGPEMFGTVPRGLLLLILFVVAGVVGAVWTILPAVLKARYGVNEIITTLMMTFIGINVANLLIKEVFQDEASNVPQTRSVPFASLLPSIPGTRIHVGVIVAAVAIVATWYVMSRTSFGLRLHVLGANARAARHVGINVGLLIIVAFLVSGFLVGLAAAAEIEGIWGYARADWNPAFGLLVVPLVFLARMNALAVVPFVAFLAVLSIGGDFATQQADLSNEFTLLLVGLILVFMAVTELLGRRRSLGQGYLPGGSPPTGAVKEPE